MTPTQAQRVAGVAIDHEKRAQDDFYATPPEGTEALLRVEKFYGGIWEPACGDGSMSEVLKTAGYNVASTDLVDRGYGEHHAVDFLKLTIGVMPNIVTNPPFKLAQEFVEKSLELATGKVAILARLQFLEGKARQKLFAEHPPSRVWVFSKRLQINRADFESTGKGGGMQAFAWFVWHKGYSGPSTLGWL